MVAQEWREYRRDRAANLCKLRHDLRSLLAHPNGLRWRVDLIRACEGTSRYPKPTVANLMAASANLREQAAWRAAQAGSHDTEYYSACGWDDYCAEVADEAERYARDCWRAAVLVAFGA